jgi:hypothetical protein
MGGTITSGPPQPPGLVTPTAPKQLTEQEQISLAIQGSGVKTAALDTSYNIAAFPAVGTNPLNKFVSYNCLFTLSCLSKSDQNAGKFDKSNIKNIIARTQGDWGKNNNRVKSGFGQFDYFIDDLIIVSQPALSSRTGEAFATKITFKVTEPYSMGLFLDTMLQGAQQGGYGNFREASYLLMIEFAGYTDDNVPHPPDPSLTRYIPIRFLDIKLKVTSGGSVYDCEVIPYNEIAFRDPIAVTKSTVSLTGDTVGSLLAYLESSLNQYDKVEITDKILSETDQYEIHFPKDFSDPGDSGNDIAKGVVFKGVDEAGNMRFPNQDDVYSPAKQIFNNKNIGTVVGKTYQFKQGTKVQDIISEVVIKSDYMTKQLTNYNVNVNKKGMIKWFRVEIHIEDLDENPKTNRQNRKFIYRVLPYEVHISKLLPPKAIPQGYDELKATVNRIYNYVYTGKNTEIINVDIDFNMAFFSKVSADAGTNTGTDNRNQVVGGGSDATPPSAIDAAKKSVNSNQHEPAVEISPIVINSGNSGGDTVANAQVRNYRAMLTNPGDMIELKMTILGDPYFLPSSGMGNQIKKPKGDNIMEDGSMNYQSGEVDIVLNFRTPIDLNPATGLYNFATQVDQFSGLFQIFEVESKFNQNKFTQVITAQRRRTQLRGSGESSTIFGSPAGSNNPNQKVG